MTEFGDDEPEDAWDASDPTSELLKVLWRMVAALDEGVPFRVRTMDEYDEMLSRVSKFLHQRDGNQVTPRELTRISQIIEGIVYLKDRDG